MHVYIKELQKAAIYFGENKHSFHEFFIDGTVKYFLYCEDEKFYHEITMDKNNNGFSNFSFGNLSFEGFSIIK